MNWRRGGAKAVEAVTKPTFDDKRFFDIIRPFFGGLNQETLNYLKDREYDLEPSLTAEILYANQS